MKYISLAFTIFVLATQVSFSKLVDSWPLVVKQDSMVQFTFVLEDEPMLQTPEKLTLQYVQADSVRESGKAFGGAFNKIEFQIEGNKLITKPIKIIGETIHTLRLVSPDAQGKFRNPKVHGIHFVYSLADDLFQLRPYRGSIHTVLNFPTEAEQLQPHKLIAQLRHSGYDFACIADNDLDKAKNAIAGFPFKTDFTLIPAEEVFIPGKSAKLLAINPNTSVGKWIAGNPNELLKAIENEANSLKIDSKEFTEQVATTHAIIKKIKQENALAILVHPNHGQDDFPYLPRPAIDAILNARQYDALQVAGGPKVDLDFTDYYELCASGPRVPAVGGPGFVPQADLARSITVVLAKSNSASDIMSAIKSGHVAAVFQPPATYRRIAADFRLGHYFAFLLRYYFPKLNGTYRSEADAFNKILDANDEQAKQLLPTLQNHVNATYDKYFAVTQ